MSAQKPLVRIKGVDSRASEEEVVSISVGLDPRAWFSWTCRRYPQLGPEALIKEQGASQGALCSSNSVMLRLEARIAKNPRFADFQNPMRADGANGAVERGNTEYVDRSSATGQAVWKMGSGLHFVFYEVAVDQEPAETQLRQERVHERLSVQNYG